MIGQRVSHYRIVGEIGEGGMGIVYRAEDVRLGRYVAVKFLSSELAKDPLALERFQREARAASALNHPHICAVYDIGQYENRPFLVMELLEGKTLRKHIGARPLSLEHVLDLGLQIADALDVAHSRGIVHRNVSPESIVVRRERGELLAMLTDFGRAKFLTGEYAHLSAEPIGGHAGYLSPEQRAGGRGHGTPTDIYVIARICYELIAGYRLPDEIIDEQPLLSAFHDDLPSSFVTIARDCIAIAPEIRPSARELFYATREAHIALWTRHPSAKHKRRVSGKLPIARVHKQAHTPVDRT